ncbi:MAG: tetratricopeptide repeat protein [Thermodesulfobacteriota bacterium]
MKIHIRVVIASILGLSLLLPDLVMAKDVSFYAQKEVDKGWEAFNGGDLDGALRDFNQASKIDSSYAQAYYGKGHVYIAQDKFGLAIRFFTKTIDLAREPMPEAYVYLGLSNALIGNEQEAVRMYNKALSIDPMNKDAHINLANYYCSELNGKKAWEHIRFALKMKATINEDLLKEMQSLCPEGR